MSDDNKVLVIVDMQYDFINKDGALYVGEKAESIIENIVAFKKLFKKVVFTRDIHPCLNGTDTQDEINEFTQFGKHCHDVKTSAIDSRLIDQNDFTGKEEVIFKSSFATSMAERFFTRVDPRKAEFHVTGVCTHICVHDVIAEIVNYSKNIYNRLPKIYLYKNMIGDFDAEMEAFAIKRLQKLYGVQMVEFAHVGTMGIEK